MLKFDTRASAARGPGTLRRALDAARGHAFPAKRFGREGEARQVCVWQGDNGSLANLRPDGWRAGIGITASPVGPASPVLRTMLPREVTAGCRAEVIPEPVADHSEGLFARFHWTYRYSFRMLLPGDYAGDSDGGDCLAQWHGIPNRLLGERYRHAPILLGVDAGRYFLAAAASKRLVVPPGEADDPRRYDRFTRVDLGPVGCDLGRWACWELEVRWSYADDGMGFFALSRDGGLLHRDEGPNCYNDLRGGPYLKLGVYKWDWAKPGLRPAAGAPIVHFYSDLRIDASAGTAVPGPAREDRGTWSGGRKDRR